MGYVHCPKQKGIQARRRTRFRAGHQYFPPRTPFETETQTVVIGSSSNTEDLSGEATAAGTAGPSTGLQMTMRPRQNKHHTLTQQSHKTCKKVSGMNLVDSQKMEAMFNELLLHVKGDNHCKDATMRIVKTEKWGLGWKYVWGCERCKFKSRKFKLYQEIQTAKPGPNPAAINMTLQTGLSDMPIGNSKARVLLTSLNVVPPALAAMQKASNKVGKTIIEVNSADMKEKRKNLQCNSPGVINIAMDTRYNSTRTISYSKPGQSSSQAVALACETMTENQYIIGTAIQNKLCSTGQYLKSRGYDIDCPEGHVDCTANIPYVAPHSEYELARCIAEELASDDILVEYVTTDGDSSAARGIQDTYKTLFPEWTVIRQADPNHLGVSQVRKCNKANFSPQMFPGCTTRAEKKAAQKFLSLDVKHRCSLVYQKLYEESGGNILTIKSRLPKVMEATLKCYNSDCSMCRRHSLVCDGSGHSDWWTRSAALGPAGISNLQMEESDLILLKEILMMRLSESAADTLKLNTSTQKLEASNRGLSVSVPKNVNLPRNFEQRIASAVLRINNAQGTALQMKINKLGASLSPDVRIVLNSLDHRTRYLKAYKKQFKVKKRRTDRLGNLRYEHKMYMRRRDRLTADYEKGKLDHPYASQSQ
ncbi:MAG: hypothetical protein AB2801_20305 [Candidatus Thiodiazotropha endolucinida]